MLNELMGASLSVIFRLCIYHLMAYFAKPQPYTSAVRIVNPADQSDEQKSTERRGMFYSPCSYVLVQHSPTESPQRQCRNILIYGYYSCPSLSFSHSFPPPGLVGSKIKAVSIIIPRYEVRLHNFHADVLSSRRAPPMRERLHLSASVP